MRIAPVKALNAIKRHVDWRLASAVGATLALGGLAAWNVSRARAAERTFPRVGRYVAVDGIILNCLERGTGRPVVLIHGNSVSSQDFVLSGLMDQLAARGYRAIAFDRPGYGYSARPRWRSWTADNQTDLVARAIASMGLERPVIVGHSWGALVALGLALDYPDEISGVVLLSGCYYPTLRADVALASVVALPLLGDLLRYTLAPISGRGTLPMMMKLMFRPRPVPHAFLELFGAMALRPSQLRAENEDGAFMEATLVALQREYGNVRPPVTIVAGIDDVVAEVHRHAVRLHDAIPHSKLDLVPGTGHMVHYAAPARVVDCVEGVLMAGHVPVLESTTPSLRV
ncbi:MAG: alpha/beta hydrolase [Alphaproteobacteria bacterium]|nr:alpha/beta hydrolase [Alphaproteobacteria bacterium]